MRPEALRDGWSRDRIATEINALGVPCYHGSCSEVYLEKAFDAVPGRPAQRLPVAQRLGDTSLVHPTLTDEHISKTCDAIALVIAKAQR